VDSGGVEQEGAHEADEPADDRQYREGDGGGHAAEADAVGQVESPNSTSRVPIRDKQPVAGDHHEQNAEDRGGERKARRR
jgi:hypothetical protein